MASINPQGDEKFWLNGLSFEGLLLGSNDSGTEKFWINGLSAEYLFPASNIESSFFLVFD
jgi:hypothetical protein